MDRDRAVIVGGNAAGVAAAFQVRHRKSDKEVVIFERSFHVSYSSCGIPYYIGKKVADADSLIMRSPKAFRKQNIDVRLRKECVELDLFKRKAKILDLDNGKTLWEPFDDLLIATGAIPIRPNVVGGDGGGIYSLDTLQSGIDFRRAISKDNVRHVAIIGGGLIGLGIAEGLVLRNIKVSLIEEDPYILSLFDPDISAIVAEVLEEIGVEVSTSETLVAFDVDKGRVQSIVTNARRVPVDVVCLNTGVRPNTEMVEKSGIPLADNKSIVVNNRMQTKIDNVWAAGNCAEAYHIVSRKSCLSARGTVSNKQGRVAGINMGGDYATFPGIVGTAISMVSSLEIARTGLNEKELKTLGLEYVAVKIGDYTRAPYLADAGKIVVKLLAERGSGRLLGGQIVGTTGSAKRIDVIAAALHSGLSVDDFINLDLGYSPPYSPVWDPILIAAREMKRHV